ncbi:FRG domain-containing protein [Fibrobacter sp. UWS1]|uniref:FRG domain-containing protein n=1 Tax=Fibrobacter sp. UWS1 TaxID=1896220 RepID=UPI000BB1482A|nr:FRG domain-containing protein [Fibrobacter sp. UWS1]PBC66436.1 FRG domain-containing protein [Fibrobacter sp. UWS1]
MDEIRSIADWIECLNHYKHYGLDVCGNRRSGVRYYFRGEGKDFGSTGATPGIGRRNMEKEAKLFRETERRIPDEFARCKSTFERLVLMQHYGIPTRLLDITTSALQSLFFACYIDPDYGMTEKEFGNADGVIYVYEAPDHKIKNFHSDAVSVVANIAVYDYKEGLDIRNLRADEENNRKAFNTDSKIQHLVHEIRAEKPYFEKWIDKKDMESIFCVHPLLDNPRVRAQQGAFLIYGMDGDRTKLAQWKDDPQDGMIRRKVRVPAQAKKRLLEELEMLGMTPDVVYPDWKGTRLRLNSEDFWNE